MSSGISSSRSASPLNYARKDYAYATLSGNQSTGIADTNPIKYNTLTTGSMLLDTANYRFTLKANKTYRMTAGVVTQGSGTTHSMGWQFYNVTAAALVGLTGYTVCPSKTSNDGSYSPAFYEITTTADTVFEVRINGVTALTLIYATYSYWEITEIENFVPAYFNYGQWAYVSPVLSLLATGVAGFVLNYGTCFFCKTSDGKWYMQFNSKYTITGSGVADITLSNIAVSNIQPLICCDADHPANQTNGMMRGTGTGATYVRATSLTDTQYTVGGFIALDAKPTVYVLPSDI